MIFELLLYFVLTLFLICRPEKEIKLLGIFLFILSIILTVIKYNPDFLSNDIFELIISSLVVLFIIYAVAHPNKKVSLAGKIALGIILIPVIGIILFFLTCLVRCN